MFFVLCFLFFVAWPTLATPGATLFLDPETKIMEVGETHTLALKVNTGPDTINAIEATVSYPTHQMEVVGVNKGQLLKIWAQRIRQ